MVGVQLYGARAFPLLPLSDYFIMHFGSEKRKLKSYMKRFFFKGPLSEVIVYYNEIGYHLGGSVFIVTGANSSIGKLLISLLESRKALVVKIVKSSKTLGENEHQCDLSDPKQVLDFCNKFKEKHSKLNGIINLASGLYETYETNDLGIEKTLATNVLAPYLLFKNLLPLIKFTTGARILNVVNPLMLTVKMDPGDLNSKTIYYARNRFLQCERYRVELWHHLAEEYPEVRFQCVTPGFVRTEGLEKKFPLFFSKYGYRAFPRKIFRDDKTASMFVLWCLITAKVSSIRNGALVFDKAVQQEYIFQKHETLAEEHKRFTSNFYNLLESRVILK